jgi:hypothetical protein
MRVNDANALQFVECARQVLSVVGPAVEWSLRPKCASLLPAISSCCEHANHAVRQSAARTLAVLAKAHPVGVSALRARPMFRTSMSSRLPLCQTTLSEGRMGCGLRLNE